jgi:Protein of unknown function (DUF3501)
MTGLTLDDLLPLEEYAGRRREFFTSHSRYLDRYRRVRIGPRVTLVFENRQTLWFRLHEILRVARLEEPARVQQELDLYNRLLPGRERLQAALLVAVENEAELTRELAPWRELHGDHLRLHIGRVCCPANLYTSRPEDRCIGAAQWIQFVLDPAARTALRDREQSAFFALTMPNYRHESAPLSEDVRQSLLDDLEMSDRAN